MASLISAITEALNVYCPESESPLYAHVYLSAIVAAAVSLAMWVLITLYFTVEESIKDRHPLGKVRIVFFLFDKQGIVLI